MTTDGVAQPAGRAPPLAGVRVLDLSRLLPGPLCGQHLADLGADVIKIEDTGAGDPARPAVRALSNRGKRALRIDLKHADGLQLFRRLVQTADVVLEGFRPGTMERLGLGYAALSALQPRLVMCSITGYGQTGPRAREAGHDLNYQALTGVLHQTGPAGGAPVAPGFLLGDMLGGTLSATVGVLAALLDARASGHGRHVDVGMADGLLSHALLGLIELNEGREPAERGQGTHTGGAAQYNLYETRDGRWLSVAAQEEKFWVNFCNAIGLPALARQHGLGGPAAAPVKQAIAERLRTLPLDEWLTRLPVDDCCVAPVLSPQEALDDPQARARGIVRRVDGSYRSGLPFKMSDLPVDLGAPSPGPGEHTAALLGELGLDAAEIDRLIATGCVGDASREA